MIIQYRNSEQQDTKLCEMKAYMTYSIVVDTKRVGLLESQCNTQVRTNILLPSHFVHYQVPTSIFRDIWLLFLGEVWLQYCKTLFFSRIQLGRFIPINKIGMYPCLKRFAFIAFIHWQAFKTCHSFRKDEIISVKTLILCSSQIKVGVLSSVASTDFNSWFIFSTSELSDHYY